MLINLTFLVCFCQLILGKGKEIKKRNGRKTKKIFRCRKWLFYLSLPLIVLFILISLAILFLPQAISTQTFRRFLERKGEEAIHRKISIERLTWSWSDGILLKGIDIKDDPSFSSKSLLSIGEVKLDVGIKALLKRRLVLYVRLDDMYAQVIRDREGVTNCEPLFTALGGDASSDKLLTDKPSQKKRDKPFMLPLEVQSSIKLSGISLHVEDRSLGKVLNVENGSFLLDVPSLTRMPIDLTITAELELDGHSLPPIVFTAGIGDIFNHESLVDINTIVVNIEGKLPGSRIMVHGTMGDQGIKSTITVDLASLMEVCKPFLPSDLSSAKIAGDCALTCTLSGDPTHGISFETSVTGNGLGISGGLLKEKSLGPINGRFQHKGTVNYGEGSVFIEDGKIYLFEKSEVLWNGFVKGFASSTPEVACTIGSLAIDLGDLYTLAKAFIPPEFLINFTSGPSSLAPTLKIEGVTFSGIIPSGPNSVIVDDMCLCIPDIELTTGGNTLILKKMNFLLSSLKSNVVQFMPVEASATSSLRIDKIQVKGPHNLIIRDLNMPVLKIFAQNIQDRDELAGRLEKLLFSAASILFEHPSLGVLSTGLELDASIENIKAYNENKIDIEGLKTHIACDTFLDASIEAGAKNMAQDHMDISGQVSVIIAELLKHIPEKIKRDALRNAMLGGKATINWNIAGRLPREAELEKLKGFTHDIKAEDAAFLDTCTFAAQCNDLSVDIPLAGGEHLKAREISTNVPLHIILEGGLKRWNIEGGIVAGRIEKLPVFGDLHKPVRGAITFSIIQDSLKSLTLSESMTIDQIKLEQKATIALSGIDALRRRGLYTPSALWLNLLECDAKTSIKIGKGADLGILNDDLAMTGELTAGCEFTLFSAKDVGARCWFDSPAMDVRVTQLLDVKKLQYSMNFEKQYRIIKLKDQAASIKKPVLPLSEEVLQPVPAFIPMPDARAHITSRLASDISGRLSKQRSLSFASTYIDLAPLPIELNNLMLDVHLDKGLPSMDYFQVDVLGGTIIGSLSLVRGGDEFYLRIQGVFSGLNAAKLLPKVIHDIPAQEAEISGQLSLIMPLSSRLDDLLQEINLEMEITHIGSRALERILYSLDPYESDEIIVKQRKLMGIGTPRWIRIGVKRGNLFLEGEVAVKGIPLSLPQIKRLNVAHLPGLTQFEQHLILLESVKKVVTILSSDCLEIDDNGRIRFRSSS
ncbi:MAG: AsmA family protein [bacterium]